jgi:hypothetical protein
MADRTEIEAVARWLYEHDAEFLIRSGWDSDTEGLKAYYYEQAAAILDRVRDARDDLPPCDYMQTPCPARAAALARSPQGEDHEASELAKFQEGLTRALNRHGVPAMPSWDAAIDWLAEHGRSPQDEDPGFFDGRVP